MGFVGSGNGSANTHIWKTTNAGQSWTPFGNTTNGLPDAPVNALLVDSGTVYAGTDVGVFQSPTSGATWTEVGAAAPLPNVAVTAIRLFKFGGTKKLRVSTYGRGIWEFALAVAPDFTNVISDSPQTVVFPQNATFHGTLSALNNYNSPVNLSCTAGGTPPPANCTPSPTPLTPTPGGTAFTVTAGGAVGDYSFNVHAVGTDANTTTHDAPVTLHVVSPDFSLAVTATPNSTLVAQNVTWNGTLTAINGYNKTVTLSCTAGASAPPATCTPSPASLTPTGNFTFTVGSTSAGTFNFNIQATDGTITHTQAVSLTVNTDVGAHQSG